ncbi:methyl-CpG-binding domain-containing protein 7-like [Pistacia vera]|uniref:methyl-CpG-binding domain-containing protein 7-like n=1 Tax=Pistacia vera TaxID=55513 RepID=UPI0012638E15|nr:methyl-CpG-binding domain-containing protein 7-like [Pistacia vera]XP_031268184.1 methyl-CpG-binding domain-containing protein 7-like [Pistacia vera]
MNKEEKSSLSSPTEQETTRELQIVDLTTSSVFKLPRGWSVEERPRINSQSHPGRVDKYYYEPKTGRKFRSLISVQKYLSGETEYAIMPKRVKYGNEKHMQIVPFNTKNTSSFGLPNHWIVEERPRRRGSIIDKYYIETGTGLRFRSRIALERYLAAMREVTSTSKAKSDDQLTKDISDENQTLRIMVKHLQDAGKIKFKPKALKLDNHSAPSKNFSFQEKHSSVMAVNPSTIDFPSLPAKVKWVLGGPGGNMWNPFVGESMVPESVKQEWSETFVNSIQLLATDNGGTGI